MVAPFAIVATQHNDNARSGWNQNESIITPSTVANLRLKVVRVLPQGTGQPVGQMLYLPAVHLNGQASLATDLVIVTTSRSWIFAYDANDLSPDSAGTALKWSRQLSALPDPFNTHVSPSCNPNDVGGHTQRYNGITSTPAVNYAVAAGSGNIYVVEKVVPGAAPNCASLPQQALGTGPGSYFRLWSIDAGSSGVVAGPVVLGGPFQVNGPGGTVFHPSIQNNRPGLVFDPDTGFITVAFGGLPDDSSPFNIGPYHGWVMSVPSTLPQHVQPTAVFVTTTSGARGGIWQAGNGLVQISNGFGSIFFATGNGDNNPSAGNFGDSIIKLDTRKLTTSVTPFTPTEQQALNTQDMDLGSAGPIYVSSPSGTSASIIQGGKEGILYNLNAETLAPVQAPFRATFNGYRKCFQRLTAGGGDHYPHIRGGPVSDGHSVYLWTQSDVPRRYPLTIGALDGGLHQNGFGIMTGNPDHDVKYCDNNDNPADPASCSVNCNSGANPSPSDNYRIGFQVVANLNLPQSDGESGSFLSLTGVNSAGGAALFWGAGNLFGGPDDANPPQPTAEESYQWGQFCAMDAVSMTALYCNPELVVWAKFVPPTIAGGHVFYPALIWDGTTNGPSGLQPGSNGDGEFLVYGL